jgi:uncharacterized protein YjiS (DUF1127 family)
MRCNSSLFGVHAGIDNVGRQRCRKRSRSAYQKPGATDPGQYRRDAARIQPRNRAAKRRRQTIVTLRSMDDRMLSDTGLTRRDIELTLRKR